MDGTQVESRNDSDDGVAVMDGADGTAHDVAPPHGTPEFYKFLGKRSGAARNRKALTRDDLDLLWKFAGNSFSANDLTALRRLIMRLEGSGFEPAEDVDVP